MAVFCRYYFSHIICNLAVNLAGFRNCLAAYTMHSLSPCYELLTALVLLNSVAIWCNATQFVTKKSHFTCLCAFGVGRNFSRGAHKWIFPKVFYGGPNVVKFGFYHSKLRKTAFFTEIFKFLPIIRRPYASVSEKFVPHHKKFWVISSVLTPYEIVKFY